MKEFLDFMRTLIGLCAILWVLFGFIIGVEAAPNSDMEPRICAGDLVFYYRLDKRPDIREIIVLKRMILNTLAVLSLPAGIRWR